MTDDERADAILAKLAPNWRENLGDGHVQEHIVTVLCNPSVNVSQLQRRLKVNAYNRRAQMKRKSSRSRTNVFSMT